MDLNNPMAKEKAPAGSVYFRKVINLEEMPDEARLVVICDNSFHALYINGQKAGGGNDLTTATWWKWGHI